MLLYRDFRKEEPANRGPRIGLALSGGGFRASIFHLGVIRRLEELGIMPHVNVISSVSGGSIIAAYYVCEMENRLRSKGGAAASTADLWAFSNRSPTIFSMPPIITCAPGPWCTRPSFIPWRS